MGFESIDISELRGTKIYKNYTSSTKEKGSQKDNDVKEVYYDEENDMVIIEEEDGDILYSKKNEVSGEYATRLIDEDTKTALMKDKLKTEAQDISKKEHKLGTGSSNERVETFRKNLLGDNFKPDQFKDTNGYMQRDKMYEWLESKGYTNNGYVEGGFNVDDLLEYFSQTAKDSADKIYYHMLANEAWLDSGAKGNNDIDGKLSNTETNNFLKDRFGSTSNISTDKFNEWVKSNINVGNEMHEDYKKSDITSFISEYKDNDPFGDNYTGKFKYQNYKIPSTSMNTSTGVRSVLNNLMNAGDFKAGFTMSDDVSVYDQKKGKNVTLNDGEKYTISDISSTYLTLEDEDGNTIKVKRGTDYSSIESKLSGNVKELIYSADSFLPNSKTTSNSSTNNGNKYNTSYTYKNQKVDSTNFESASDVSKVMDKLYNMSSFGDTSIKMSSNAKVYDVNQGEYVTLYNGKSYEITDVSKNYVTLDVDGEEVKVARGTTSNKKNFEYAVADAIKQMTYSGSSKISGSSSSSSGNYKYEDYTLSSSNFEEASDVSNVLNKLKNADDFEANIKMQSSTNVYDVNTGEYVTLKNGKSYEITDVTSSYVMLDVDGEEVKVKRGTSSSSKNFEYAVADAIKQMKYSSDTKISGSTGSSTSSGNYKYENYKVSADNLESASEISSVLSKLYNSDDFEAKIKMSDAIEVYDVNQGEYVTLKNGKSYEITDVSSSYITLDVDGEEVKVKRGTSSSSKNFEYAAADAIKELTYSSDTKISGSTGYSGSSNSGISNVTLSNYSASNVSNYLDALQDADDFEATLTISKKNWFDADNKTLLSTGEYKITSVDDRYVMLEDEDGEEIKIRRGTGEYRFEWYASRENDQNKTDKTLVKFYSEIYD